MRKKEIELEPPEANASTFEEARPARRGFLGIVGAGGLASAAAVFGTAAPAQALCKRACCALLKCPNISWRNCTRNADYVWNCKWTTTRGCTCCEKRTNGRQRSAYHCSHV